MKFHLPKINSNGWGGWVIAAAVIIGGVLPGAVYLLCGVFAKGLCAAGGAILAILFVLLLIERKQDNAKIPYYERALKSEIPFDPETQEAVIRSSICSGEKVAGFKDRKSARFTEVMVIRTSGDLKRFKAMYDLDTVKTEY